MGYDRLAQVTSSNSCDVSHRRVFKGVKYMDGLNKTARMKGTLNNLIRTGIILNPKPLHLSMKNQVLIM
jgi:hypothetical protein